MAEKKCQSCGAMFTDKPSRLARRKVCSWKCLSAYMASTNKGASNPHWKGGAPKFTCVTCGTEFSRHISRTQRKPTFCRSACRSAWDRTRKGSTHPNWKGGPPKARTTHCAICDRPGVRDGKTAHAHCMRVVLARQRREANSATKAATQKSWFGPCSVCGERMRIYPSGDRKSTRHRKCRNVRGSANPNWRGGITPKHRRIRNSPEYKAWRLFVFVRDKYTCRECGQVGGKLHADHIVPFSVAPELRLDVSNGRTMCIPCHMRTPSYLGGAKKLAARGWPR